MGTNKKALMIFSTVVSAVFLFLSCSNNTYTSDYETGSIAFHIEWPSDLRRITQEELDQPLDCSASGIDTITLMVFNANGRKLKEESFLCSVGEGTVSDIEPGSNIELKAYARNGSGVSLYNAAMAGITIESGKITDVGTLVFEEVDSTGDDDNDDVINGLDRCPDTPIGAEVNENGCPDTDVDGVYDDEDNCQGTPIGLEVDTNGCTETYTNSLGMNFIHISAGTFIMGSPDDELAREENEIQHEVSLTQSFYMQTTEVTQAQWQDVMGSNPSQFSSCPNCPVEMVSWNDVQEFIADLNAMGEGTYSLPTEAQWEYAARAGSATAFANGDIMESGDGYDANLDEMGWYFYNSNGMTHEAAQKDANSWGLYDMHGNVVEWCQDWYGPYPSTSVTDPIGDDGSRRVARGGGWYNSYARYCRSAYRSRNLPEDKFSSMGFRLLKLP